MSPWERLKALSDLGSRDPDNREHDEAALKRAAIAYVSSIPGTVAMADEILRLDDRIRLSLLAVLSFRRIAQNVLELLSGPSITKEAQHEALTMLRMSLMATAYAEDAE
jgi:hypothetical protein